MTGNELLAKTVENCIDYLDWCSDESERRGSKVEVSLDKWYHKLNKALDAYNRQQAGIPPAAPFGRPLGSIDRMKRKTRKSFV